MLDRTNMLEKMGFDRLNEDHREVYLTFYWELEQEIQSFFSVTDTAKFIKTATKNAFYQGRKQDISK